MGYSSSKTQLIDWAFLPSVTVGTVFAQNVKTGRLLSNIRMEQITGFRGHLLTDEDLIIRKHILNLICAI
jgi:oxygen-independent coproporphyrinogen-3 oxidase